MGRALDEAGQSCFKCGRRLGADEALNLLRRGDCQRALAREEHGEKWLSDS